MVHKKTASTPLPSAARKRRSSIQGVMNTEDFIQALGPAAKHYDMVETILLKQDMYRLAGILIDFVP
jgi:hypothetical protein